MTGSDAMSLRRQMESCPEIQSLAGSRRDFIKVGALATTGLGLGDLLRLTAEAKAVRTTPVKSVIVLQKYGAPSHIDTWDMKPNAPREIRGEFEAIKTSVPGYVVSEHMPRIAKLVGKMTIVRSFGHTDCWAEA